MRYFLAGGAGFIGTHLTRRLVESGHHVVIFDNLSTGIVPEAQDGVKFVRGDIAWSHLFPEMDGCDVVVNLACVDMEDCAKKPTHGLQTNVTGTLNLLERARRGCRRFVQISSCSVYGSPDKAGPIPEDAPLKPFTPYAAQKVAGEALVQAYHAHKWVDATIIRPSNVYGPGQIPPRHRGVVGKFIYAKIKGQKAYLFGDFRRDFTYVDDLVEGIVIATERGGLGPYNLAYGIGTSIRDLSLVLGVETVDAEPREIDLVYSRTMDIMKAQRELKYEPRITLPAGLAKHEAWMRGVL